MWDIELACEPVGPLVGEAALRALVATLPNVDMDVRWGRRVLRLRFAVRSNECMAVLGSLSRDLARLGFPVRLYQINPVRPLAATERLVY